MGVSVRNSTKDNTKKSIKRAANVKPTSATAAKKIRKFKATALQNDLNEAYVLNGNDLNADARKALNKFGHFIQHHVQRKASKQNAYIWVQANELSDDKKPLLQLVVVYCDCIPTMQMGETSIQTQNKRYFQFSDIGFMWKSIDANTFFVHHDGRELVSDRGFDLVIRKPSDVEKIEPLEVATVQILYDGKKIEWSPGLETITDLFEANENDIFSSLTLEQKTEVRTLLKEERSKLKEMEKAKVDQEKKNYMLMIEQIAKEESLKRGKGQFIESDKVIEALNNAKIYKYYSSDVPKPRETKFGLSGGVRKDKCINYWLKADEVF